jgi:peptidoglycan/xylan/chitin deacetylase (PgdA/CDA1 family)/uncharacterized caspase-like protein/predicted negative regulator of RcsB-dependent stress response
MSKKIVLPAVVVLALVAGGLGWRYMQSHPTKPSTSQATQTTAASQTASADEQDMAALKDILASYRKIIVVMADEKTMSETDLQSATTVGQSLFHGNLGKQQQLSEQLDKLASSKDPKRFDRMAGMLDYIESDPALFDADRLAFREVLSGLQQSVARDSSLQAIKLHKRIGDDLDALGDIEHNYQKEISQIFSHFDSRAIVEKREKWEDYVAHLKKIYTREQILKDYGVITPYPLAKAKGLDDENKEIFGDKLPPKTLLLSFDDGPHPQYTDEVIAILKQYDLPAVFFQVGRNLGTLDAQGQAKLGPNAAISRKLLAQGYAIGNHSYTHAQLSKETGDALKAEINNTDALLQAVDAKRPPLFRFPYGARNAEGLALLRADHLRSVMWNIDSLDWADPVPSSIADRVLRQVDKEGHGIILFHDIHERTLKALPLVLDRLVAEGYRFASWDGENFTVKGDDTPTPKDTVTTGYADSWAVVVGINNYAKWPKLQYAVNDAQSVRDTLVDRFKFPAGHVILLKDGEATRNNILAAFHDKLVHGGVKRNDRVFVFFAGHGATRKLSSGRDVGYIIPVDADTNDVATDAIPMTEIQNIGETLTAKHVFFVMDACYSGLGLTRGGGNGGFLRDNAKRIGRQMLTAGGADQMVADGGPNGHSIFTWTLLQGLSGKADLNGDGMITATELAAYLAPAVSSVSQQTPAFGSLPGSEGGEFVFELPADTEFLSADSAQLPSDAIALNKKLDDSHPAAAVTAEPGKAATVAPVAVKDLQGNERQIALPATVNNSPRQLAQHANDRGLQLYKEKRYAEAEAQFTEALKLRPDFALAANNLGFIYYKQEKYAEAARWFENTIKLDPSRAIAYVNLGDAYNHAGDKDRATKAWQTYLELAPKGPSVNYVKQQLGMS